MVIRTDQVKLTQRCYNER